jgi:hypothetical protein
MMGGRKHRRVGGKAGRHLACWCARAAILAGAVLPAYPAARLSAQVGYPPDGSPYRDLKRGRTLILGAGYLTGGRGVVGVGPSNGRIASARFEVPFGQSSVAFFLGAAYGQMSRFVADPTKDSAAHISGPVNTNVTIVEGGLHLMLSGDKMWHAFAPYVGFSGGGIVATDPPADSSGYRFRVKGIFGPELGLRWYLGRRIAVRTDARLVFWQLYYPPNYKQPSPDGSRVLQVGAADKQWTRHPWISIGLGWTF